MMSSVLKMSVPNVAKFAATGDNTISQCKSNRTCKRIKLLFHTFVTCNNYFIVFASRRKAVKYQLKVKSIYPTLLEIKNKYKINSTIYPIAKSAIL